MSLGRLRSVALSTIAASATVASLLTLGTTGASAAGPSLQLSATPKAGWVPNDGVHALAQDADWIYLGGSFTALTNPTTQATVAAAGLARVSITTGALDQTWTPSVDGDIRTMTLDPSSSTLYIGGDFTQVDGAARGGLGAVATDDSGSLSSWNPGATDGEVRTLIQLDSHTLLAGGAFNNVGTHRLEHLAKISTAGAIDGTFHPAINGSVYNVNHPAGASFVYIGGLFTKLGTSSRVYIGALDFTTGQPTSWDPGNPCGTATEVCPTFAFVPTADAIYASSGGPGGRVSSYNPTTGARKWSVTSDGDDQALALINGELFVGGHFGPRWGSVVRQTLASVNSTTGATTDWAPHAYDYYPGTWALMPLPDGSLAVGGDQRGFGSLGGHFTIFPANKPNVAPTASFSSSCSADTCTFDGTGSLDTDGTVTQYSWDFGDGTTGSGAQPTHQYVVSGPKTVTLTVTDDDDASDAIAHGISVTVPRNPISYVGSATAASGSTSSKSVAVPSGTQVGDTLLMYFTAPGSSNWTSPDGTWNRIGNDASGSVTSQVWTKVATTTDLGSKVTLTTNASGGDTGALTMAAYRGVDTSATLTASHKEDTNSAVHTSPTVTSTLGDWVASYWSDRSSNTTQWTGPSDGRVRQATYDSSNPGFSSLLVDSGPVAAGKAGGLTATADSAGSATEMWSVSLPKSATLGAARGPNGIITATPVVLYATVDSYVTVTADLGPQDRSQYIKSATLSLTATVKRSASQWTDSHATVALTNTDGEHFIAKLRIPRNASPGAWVAKITAVDTAGTSGSVSTTFPVLQQIHLTLGFSPSVPRASGTVTMTGSLKAMTPQPSSSSAKNGKYTAYAGKSLVLKGPELPAAGVKVTTNSHGVFTYRMVVYAGGLWSVTFGGTSYRAPAAATTTMRVVSNSTRIVHYAVDSSTLAKSGYITVSGVLERNDPNGSSWILYKGKAVAVFLGSNTHQVSATTNTAGAFSVRVTGTTASLAGIWFASFAGTPYNLPSVTTGIKVP